MLTECQPRLVPVLAGIAEMLGTSHRSQRTPDPGAGESSAPAPRAHLAPGTMGAGDNTEWADAAANITHRSNNCKNRQAQKNQLWRGAQRGKKRSQPGVAC